MNPQRQSFDTKERKLTYKSEAQNSKDILFGFPKYQHQKSWYHATNKAKCNSSKIVWGKKSSERPMEIDLDNY